MPVLSHPVFGVMEEPFEDFIDTANMVDGIAMDAVAADDSAAIARASPLDVPPIPPHLNVNVSGISPVSPTVPDAFGFGDTTPRVANSSLQTITFDVGDGAVTSSASQAPSSAAAFAGASSLSHPLMPPQGGNITPLGWQPQLAYGMTSMPGSVAVKQEPGELPPFGETQRSSPFTELRSDSPVSSAPTSLEHGSPPLEKRRRLGSCQGDEHFPPSIHGTSATGACSKASKKNTKRKSIATTAADASTSFEDAHISDETKAKLAKAGKRLPPSAFHITEAGKPFPIVDTSAKHSSLFVPPDTSGLTKREARLVKNRAAAFLSRQRKREQFEELDGKCRSMCRLIWRMWEALAGPDQSWEVFEGTILAALLRDEGAGVIDVLQQIVQVKGANIAPTEDGSPARATSVKAGSIEPQAQHELMGSSGMAEAHIPDGGPAGCGPIHPGASVPASAMGPAGPMQAPPPSAAAAEIAHLRGELFAAHQREAALQMELAAERARRDGPEAHELLERRRPFRPGAPASQDSGLSLTMAAGPGLPDQSPSTHGRSPSFEQPPGLPGAFRFQDDSAAVAMHPGSHWAQHRVRHGDVPKPLPCALDDGRQSSCTDEDTMEEGGHPSRIVSAQGAGALGPKRTAGGVALMAMIFTFAFLGLPNAAVGPGGISRAPGTESVSLGRVLGPVSASDLRFASKRRQGSERDGSPSSHLSAEDLSISDLLGETHLEEDEQTQDFSRLMDAADDVLGQGNGRVAKEGAPGVGTSSAALQRVLGAPMDMDWFRGAHDASREGPQPNGVDVERGFILIGDPDGDRVDEREPGSSKPAKGRRGSAKSHRANASKVDAKTEESSCDRSQAPTKLTLFVPAPKHDVPCEQDVPTGVAVGRASPKYTSKAHARSPSGARLASGSASASAKSAGAAPRAPISISASRTETLENASKAALEVLQNHRLAAAQAAAVARAKATEEQTMLGTASASHPLTSPRAGSNAPDEPGVPPLPTSGDFLQLEFSLSGAKVRNGRELIELLTTAASRALH